MLPTSVRVVFYFSTFSQKGVAKIAFDNVPFPLEIKHLRVTPLWSVTAVGVGGGATQRMSWWSDALRKFEFDLGTITLANYILFEKHFNGRRAGTRSWPFLDRSNYKATVEAFGTGDGSTVAFQLKKDDGDSGNAYLREIYKPKTGTVTIFDNAATVNPANYSINYATGIVTFNVAPVSAHALTWTGEFYVPVTYMMNEITDADLFMWVENGKQLVNVSGIACSESRDYQ
jgi:uncharacterized protein (TIGR02217 family)